jgi:integral membrane protein (TIGR01906 family)
VFFFPSIGYNLLNFMKIIKQITLVLFVLCMPVLLFTASISIAANCVWLYDYGFHKYDIPAVTGIDYAELHKAAKGIIQYWNSGEKDINITVIKNGQPFTLFNEREVGHMVDVKALFRLAYKFLLGTFIYALVFLALALWVWKDKKLLGVGLLWGPGFSILLVIMLGVTALIDFDWLFTQFHLLSFTNDLWLLNPATDYLIMLFPQGFWFDAVIVIFALMVIMALAIGLTGWRVMKKSVS